MKGYRKITKKESKELVSAKKKEEICLPFKEEYVLVRVIDEIFGSKIFYSNKFQKYLIAIWDLSEYEISDFLLDTKKECEELIYEAALIRGGHYEGFIKSNY